MKESSSFFYEESGNNVREGIEQLDEYINEETDSLLIPRSSRSKGKGKEKETFEASKSPNISETETASSNKETSKSPIDYVSSKLDTEMPS